MQNSRKPRYVPSLSPANVAGKTAEGHPEARQEVIGFLLSKLWAKSVNLRHKNCQNANVELAIKIYVQCKKKRNSPCSLFTYNLHGLILFQPYIDTLFLVGEVSCSLHLC